MAYLRIQAKDVKVGDRLRTGSYGSIDEHGNDVKYPIFETVTHVKVDGGLISITFEETNDRAHWLSDSQVTVIRND